MNTDATALELVRFTIDPASEADMLAARPAAVRTIRRSCPGLLDARLFRGDEPGQWIDVWFWSSLDEATAAARAAVDLPEAQAFFGFITEPPAMTHGVLVAADLATDDGADRG